MDAVKDALALHKAIVIVREVGHVLSSAKTNFKITILANFVNSMALAGLPKRRPYRRAIGLPQFARHSRRPASILPAGISRPDRNMRT